MNILIVALDFKPGPGGIAEYTHQIAKQLHLTGEEIIVLAKKMNGDNEFDRDCPYKIYRYNYGHSGSLINFYKYLVIHICFEYI